MTFVRFWQALKRPSDIQESERARACAAEKKFPNVNGLGGLLLSAAEKTTKSKWAPKWALPSFARFP